MRKIFIAIMLSALAISTSSNAEIYKWVDAQGTVHYSDQPVGNAQRAELPTLQGLDRQAVAPSQTKQKSASSGPISTGNVEVAIIRPLPQETFRDGRGLVSVQAAISPKLAENQSLVFYLDGSPTAASPTRSSSLQLQGIVRGEHQLSVAVVSGDKEITRSPPVLFYMKPPSVLAPVSQTAPNSTDQQPAGATTSPPSVRSPGSPAAPRFGTTSGPAGAPGT